MMSIRRAARALYAHALYALLFPFTFAAIAWREGPAIWRESIKTASSFLAMMWLGLSCVIAIAEKF